MSWGWRIPFVASIILVIIGLWIRFGLPESFVFEREKAEGNLAKSPLIDTFKYHWKTVFKIVGCRIAENALYYIISTYIITFATLVGYSRSSVLTAVNIAAFITIFTIPVIGHYSDSLGRRNIYIIGTAAMAIFSIPYFFLSSLAYGWLICLTIVGLAVVWALMYSVQGALFPEMFPTNVRFTGASMGAQIAGVLGGGLAPMISVFLYSQFNSYWAISVYMIAIALLSFVSAVSLKKPSYQLDVDVRKKSV